MVGYNAFTYKGFEIHQDCAPLTGGPIYYIQQNDLIELTPCSSLDEAVNLIDSLLVSTKKCTLPGCAKTFSDSIQRNIHEARDLHGSASNTGEENHDY